MRETEPVDATGVLAHMGACAHIADNTVGLDWVVALKAVLVLSPENVGRGGMVLHCLMLCVYFVDVITTSS